MLIKNYIDNFLNINDIKNTEEGRYYSWNIVFNDFNKTLESKQNYDDDYLARSLALYLGSWGMLRGSSKLLTDYNYLVHKPIIKILLENLIELKKYPENINEIDTYTNMVYNTIKKLKTYYIDKDVSTTDTLITKILLGTSASTPAYDTNFKLFLKENKITQVLSQKSLKEIWYFYFQQESLCYNYPPMKLIDMAGFQFGKEMRENYK